MGSSPGPGGCLEPAGAVRGVAGLLAVCCRCGVLRGGAGLALGTPGPAGTRRAELTARGWPRSGPSETAGGGSGPPTGGGDPAGRTVSPPGSRYGPEPLRAHRGQSPAGHGRGDAAKPTRARSRAAPGRGSHAWIRCSAFPRCGRWGAAPTAPPRPCLLRGLAVVRGSPRGAAGRGVRRALLPLAHGAALHLGRGWMRFCVPMSFAFAPLRWGGSSDMYFFLLQRCGACGCVGERSCAAPSQTWLARR